MAHYFSAGRPGDLAALRALNTTTFLVPNLHCPSCVSAIHSTLESLDPKPFSVTHSIISHSITIRHHAALPIAQISKALERAGFEVYDIIEQTSSQHELHESQLRDKFGPYWVDRFSSAIEGWRLKKTNAKPIDDTRSKTHIDQCEQCRAEISERSDSSPQDESSLLRDDQINAHEEKIIKATPNANRDALEHKKLKVVIGSPDIFQASFLVEGMTCSSCVGAISRILNEQSWVISTDVSLLTNSASVKFYDRDHRDEIVQLIENIGYDATLDKISQVQERAVTPQSNDSWRITVSVRGMTCSTCVGTITTALKEHDWIENFTVNLVSNCAIVEFRGRGKLAQIKEIIEDVGFDAELGSLEEVKNICEQSSKKSIELRIDGMYCKHCPSRISDALDRNFGKQIQIDKPVTQADPILRVTYSPNVPDFTIRHILAALVAADPSFRPSVYHPPTLEERSRRMQSRERKQVLYRLCLAFLAAIPTFVIGVVMMSLLPSTNISRRFVMEPIWTGQVSRGEWALFIIATPVYFFSADAFHRPALRELRALWRPGSRTPIIQRFYRFGSMSMLISLGTTIAYVSSIAELAVRATQSRISAGTASSYFDSVVFLTMFLLCGRFLEAYTKAKTGDAITLLGQLRPTEANLLDFDPSSFAEQNFTAKSTKLISVDLLEVGDVVKVLQGSSPPADGTVVGTGTTFDESSLTGESELVEKIEGDHVYSGTVNRGKPVLIRISSISGASMLDQIVRIVREGQTKRAPIESLADTITSHFVPLVVFLAILTWIIWLTLGVSGSIPESYKDGSVGGWPYWSLEFAIAVFVVACPCGIGLASPTALFVGGGLAARHGVLAKGGGEAFQEASRLDCIVFDKTGTLTLGGELAITDYKIVSPGEEKFVLGIARGLEENSNHPVAKAVVSFCNSKSAESAKAEQVEEIAGNGMKGRFTSEVWQGNQVEAIIGNEAFMTEYNINVSSDISDDLGNWKKQGKSIALLALCTDSGLTGWNVSAVFASSDPLRPDAESTVRSIQEKGIQVWMISGDNAITARTVGEQVGIPADQVIAGVLPDQKAEKIQYLQRSVTKSSKNESGFWRVINHRPKRAVVAMVGDGINDSPALAVADVGIAIGSGSDIAISSAEFVLLSPNLKSLLTLIELSRVVFRRVKFNFFWALVYNLAALPIAAGALYSVKSNGSHIRLDPVWASLAMALSSVSVVCSSLLLKSKLPVVGFRS